jgi:hypothetical protein
MHAAKLFITALLGLAACGVQADTVGLHLASIHMSSGKYNNYNPGLYWRADRGLTIGGYRNSENRNSYYAGWTFEDRSHAVGLTVGAVSGYWKKDGGKLMPLVALSVRPLDNVRITFTPASHRTVAVLHFSLETRL